MPAEVRIRDVPVSARIDGSPWTIRVVEVDSGRPGPVTGVIGGMYGDKPLGVLAVHRLIELLRGSEELHGSVLLVPAANLPALERGTRVNPDHRYLNRQFPGSPRGFLTDQIADRLGGLLLEECGTIVDLHSGTPMMELGYTYDFGDVELSASFGYLPVVVGFPPAGQLGWVAAERGRGALLPEFAGGRDASMTVGVEGTLNVLRYRGHLGGPPTGPSTVPLVTGRELLLSSTAGMCVMRDDLPRVGEPVPAGPVARIVNPVTGEPTEELRLEQDGIVLMSTVGPRIVEAGDFVLMAGHVDRDIEVPSGR